MTELQPNTTVDLLAVPQDAATVASSAVSYRPSGQVRDTLTSMLVAKAASQKGKPTENPRPNQGTPGSFCLATLGEQLKNATIMVVDDEELNIHVVCAHLKKEGYHNFVRTTDPHEALTLIRTTRPDCLLLDINMPHVSGLDILRTKFLDSNLQHIPTIVLTASADPTTKQQSLQFGAADFLTKPVDPTELIPRVRNVLMVKAHIDHMTHEATRLEALVQRRTEELVQSRQQLILSLARAAEHRDNETSNHVIRVGKFAGIIARALGWSEDKVQMLEQAAQLHDVGKIGIPDAILFKPGKLDPQEFATIKKHCGMGVKILEPYSDADFEIFKAHAGLGASIMHVRSSPMLMLAARIAQTHHERWDGAGYPLGLAGTDIPIEGRITAVADVYDALSTERPYKKAFPRARCFEILQEGRGTQFDAQIVDAFFKSADEIVEVQLKLMDR